MMDKDQTLYELNINRDLNYDIPQTPETITSRSRKAIPDRFKGKVAIVTGGTSGIGFSIVEELLKEGCAVAFSGRNEKTAIEAEEILDAQGLKNYLFIKADTSKEEDCIRTVETTAEKFGRIDYLVNNAFPFGSTRRDLDNELWYRSFIGGPLAYAQMMQLVAPHMIKVGGGSIVNVSSISGHITQGGRWTYNTMKGIVGQLSNSAAKDFARDNIRVNLMSPAHIWTRQTKNDFNHPDPNEVRDSIRYTAKGYMLNRGGEPVECAAATLFLLSDDASYITGSEFMVDAGFLTLGSQGSIDKGFRDEREYSLEPIYGRHYSGTKFTKPTSHYPELFEKLNKEVDR